MSTRDVGGLALEKIEITPEMIEAGMEELWEFGYGRDPTVRTRDVVREVLEAALRERTACRPVREGVPPVV